MIDINDIPQAWRDILATVQEYFPGAVIAGGCLRDLENNRTVKDIDVFVPNCTDVELAKSFALGLCPDAKMLSNQNAAGQAYTNWAATEVVAIFDIMRQELDFQLICLSTGSETVIPRIDFGLCRIAFDGEQIIRTDEYHADRVNECLTLHRCDDSLQWDRSMRRYERLAKKYEGWPMKVAPHLKSDGCDCFRFEGCFCAFS